MSNRRTRFREYMARLNAAASPQQALDAGFYVAPPAELSIAHEVASRLELQPASTHLVVGGVGSGKTTELLAACHRLADDPDIAATYVDIGAQSDLADFSSDAFLVAIVEGLGQGLSRQRPKHHPSIEQALANFESWRSFGATGITDVAHDRDVFTELVSAYASVADTPVLFMDSLDRLPEPLLLEAALKTHANLLRNGDLGLVLAGSIRLRHGLDRSLRDMFDQIYNTPYVNTDDESGLTFLTSVLRARLPASLLDAEACQHLATWSGGVLRDLLTLAQAAVNEAYVRGGDQVAGQHIRIAADGFGRKQMLGLDSQEIATLQRVRTRGTFVETSRKDLGLLLTRHILEYQDSAGETIYRVHPTLRPLLEQIEGAT